MGKEKYIDKLYEEYSENFERSEEYQSLSEKLEEKYYEIETNFTDKQQKIVDEFEQCLVELYEMETKMAFEAGFKAGVSLRE